MIRKACENDIPQIVKIYDRIIEIDLKEGRIGWLPNVYPTKETALEALACDTLFVMEINNEIVAACKIDQNQVPVYANCPWEYPAPNNQVMVLHTLVVDPEKPHQGFGKTFVKYYEEYAKGQGCPFLRIDTNEKNIRARAMYKKLGYKEICVLPCIFNGIPDVNLVCMEKKL